MKRIFAFILLIVMLLTLTACTDAQLYPDFLAKSTPIVTTPGLEDDFVPQGLCKAGNIYLVSGYMTDKTNARVYRVSKDNVDKGFVLLTKPDGSDYTAHAGGVACSGDNVWVVSGNDCYRFSLSEILSAKTGDKVQAVDRFDIFCGGAFCFVDDKTNTLWIGEFYEKNDYKTDESHHYDTGNGTNYAIALAYAIGEGLGGVESTTPTKALSIREKVQGFAITDDGSIVLSTSYGRRNDSNIFVYLNVLTNASNDTFDADGTKVPLWYLSDSSMTLKLKCPPMTEGIDYDNGKVLVLFESAAKKYVSSGRNAQTEIFALDVD